MSYKGTYEGNSLKHYRTPGSKNGRTKYPGKYNPIGELAKGPDYNNSMNAARAYDIAQRAARQTALGPRAINNSYNHPSYQQAQAKAMQARNKAYGQAYGQMKVAGKNAALQKAKNVNTAKNVGTTASHPTGQPNKGDYGKPNRQAQAEARRIAGGSAGTSFNQQKLVDQRKASGSKMERTPEQNRMDAERRRIAGGSTGTITRAEANRRAAEERRAGGFSKTTDAAQSRKSNYQALVNRRAAEQRRTGVTSNQAAAEARRIAGSKLGSGYVDSGAGNFRRGVKLAGQAIKERMNPNHEQRSMNKHYGQVINETVSKYHAKQAAKEIGTGIKKGADYAVNEGKSLVKKGKKKVRSLMKRIFN